MPRHLSRKSGAGNSRRRVYHSRARKNQDTHEEKHAGTKPATDRRDFHGSKTKNARGVPLKDMYEQRLVVQATANSPVYSGCRVVILSEVVVRASERQRSRRIPASSVLLHATLIPRTPVNQWPDSSPISRSTRARDPVSMARRQPPYPSRASPDRPQPRREVWRADRRTPRL